MLLQNGPRLFSRVGATTRQELIAKDAEGIEVGPLVDRVPEKPCLLGGHVVESTRDSTLVHGSGIIDKPGQAEVQNLYDRKSFGCRRPLFFAGRDDHDVGWLDVTVEDAFSVGVIQAFGYLAEYVEEELNVGPEGLGGLYSLPEALSLEKLKDDELGPVALSTSEELHDVHVAELGQGGGLSPKSKGALQVLPLFLLVQYLQGHLMAQLVVYRLIDSTKAPFSDT